MCHLRSLGELLKEFASENVIVVFRRMNFWSGILCYVKQQWFCYVNSANPIPNQRWTIAHELGHYVLHKKSGLYFTDGIFQATEVDAEWQANRYASEILMPQEEVAILMDKTQIAAERVLRTSGQFEVPQKMAAWWLYELGYISKRCFLEFQQPPRPDRDSQLEA